MTVEKKYLHTGWPCSTKLPGMTYLPILKVWIGYNADYDAEYLYWEPDTPMPKAGYAEAHVAYEVADINAAVALPGTEIILPPLDVGPMIISYVRVPWRDEAPRSRPNGPIVEWVQRK